MMRSVRPISQVLLHVSNDSEANLFDEVRKVILKWIESKAGDKLPAEAWRGDSFAPDGIGTQRTEAVALPDQHFWAAHLDDADKKVAQRTWTTEVVVHEEEDGTVRLGCRLQCVTHGDDASFERSIPKFVRHIVEVKSNTVKLDGRPISVKPWFIDSNEQVKELVRLLLSPHRRSDVIVFSLPEQSTNQDETAASAPEVAWSTVGAAHVAVIAGQASRDLSELIGKEFSVYNRAIRTYRPGFNPDTDEPRLHPRRLSEQIAEWGDEGPEAYERLLISQALLRSISGQDIAIERELPPFPKLRHMAAVWQRERERQQRERERQDSSQEELLELLYSENKELKDERDNLEGRLAAVEKEYEDFLDTVGEEQKVAQEAYKEVKSKNFYLRERVDDLQKQLEGSGQSTPPVPDSLDGFKKWYRENLSGFRVELHKRAFEGVKDSQYKDVPLIYKALLLLRDYYVPMRREGGKSGKNAFDKKCRELGIEETQTFSGEKPKVKKKEQYKVDDRDGPRWLDRHLKKGTSHDSRLCFRLYFFWDDEEEQVVVGWLPSHLDTRAT